MKGNFIKTKSMDLEHYTSSMEINSVDALLTTQFKGLATFIDHETIKLSWESGWTIYSSKIDFIWSTTNKINNFSVSILISFTFKSFFILNLFYKLFYFIWSKSLIVEICTKMNWMKSWINKMNKQFVSAEESTYPAWTKIPT